MPLFHRPEVIMVRRFGMVLVLATVVAGTRYASAAGGSVTGTVTSGGAAAGEAVVYIQHAEGTFKPAGPATMDQRSMKFAPHVLPVVVGTSVKFLNSDSTQHNVFSPDYEKYNLGTWPQGETKEHAFATCAKPPCAYVQLCRIHPEMEAYVVVLQNPFFAITDATGHYKIDNVPPGPYTVGVWATKGKAPAKPVTVDAAMPATVNFALGR
jgi:plastocyanin